MQDPYRPQAPPPDPELARLAMQGQQRRAEMASRGLDGVQDYADRNLRTAIGGYRGSTLKRSMLVLMIGGALAGVLGAALSALGSVDLGACFLPGFGVAFVLFMIWVFTPPLASKATVAAEQEWMMALPFPLAGYFEALGSEPRYQRTLTYEIVWREGARPPDPALVHSVFCAVDPRARLDNADERSARLTASPVSGGTGIRINNSPVYRNHRLPGQVHSVVDQVLLTLHRTYPIARVVLRG